jgi:phage antirepressor YoqD-like protein
VLAAERRLASLNRTDRLQPYELALALYADALAEPANATANLTEAAKVMDSLQPQVAALLGPKELRSWIRQAQARH